MSSWFDKNGYVKLDRLPREKKKLDEKPLTKQELEEIEICLNCTSPKCNGNCLKIRRRKNGKIRHY